MKKKRIKISSIITVILFFIIIFSGMKIIDWMKDNKKTKENSKKINDLADVKEVKDDKDTILVSEVDDKNNPYWYYIKFNLLDVNISELKKKNSDIVGWINVNNTNVNYPFVQTDNNDYYLNHSIDKTYNDAGWIFMDYRNDSSFNNRNNIIYGHSRLDKSMFGSLSKALKSNWYNNKDNHIIRISTETENSLWQIFSVYKIKTEGYYITTYFSDNNEYLGFLNTLKSRSLYDFQTDFNENDIILTLSTCYYDSEKTVINAKLIKKSKKN